MNDAAHEMLRNWWRDHEGPTGKAVSPTAVATLGARYGMTFPDDFRAYLLHAAPAEETFDEEFTTWWPFERLRSLAEECTDREPIPALREREGQCLVFIDHFVWAWAWAICCTDDENHGKVILLSDKDRFVADNFTDFVHRYTSDWSSLC